VVALDARTGRDARISATMARSSSTRHGARMAGEFRSLGAGDRPRIVVVGSPSPTIARRGAAGAVRGLDARTGAVRWSWDPDAPASRRSCQCLGADVGRAMRRAVVSADLIGEPGFLGRQAARQHAHANSVVALRIETANCVGVSRPCITRLGLRLRTAERCRIETGSGPRDVVIQGTKQASVRARQIDGTADLAGEERPVPQQSADGEQCRRAAFPTHLPTLVPQPSHRRRLRPASILGPARSVATCSRARARGALHAAVDPGQLLFR